MKHGKHYVEAAKLIDRTKVYDPQEALELCCKTARAKFDETVELLTLLCMWLLKKNVSPIIIIIALFIVGIAGHVVGLL